MKKRLIGILCCTAVILSALLLFSALPAEAVTENGLTYTVTGNEATLTKCDVTDEDFRIPETLGGFPVTALKAGFLKTNPNVKTLRIPASVQKIPKELFRNYETSFYCPETVIFEGETVAEMSDQAFYLARGLRTVVLPSKMTATSRAMFRSSTIENIVLPETLQTIADETFYDCPSLKTIRIPESVTTIGSKAFYSDVYLSSILDLYNVRSIGTEAFRNCQLLSHVKIYQANCKIGSGAFRQCSAPLHLYGRRGSTAYTYCQNDGETYPYYNCLTDEDHVYSGEGIVALAPTERYFGLMVRQCETCKKTEKTSIPKLTSANE